MTTPRTFRVKRYIAILGVVIVLAGLAITAWPIFHLINGQPMMVSGGRTGPAHVATRSELISLAMWSLVISLGGLPLIIFAQIARVTLDAVGITVVNGLGQTTFHARYDQVQSVGEPQKGNKELYFMVEGAGQSIRIANSIEDWEEMRTSLISRTNR